MKTPTDIAQELNTSRPVLTSEQMHEIESGRAFEKAVAFGEVAFRLETTAAEYRGEARQLWPRTMGYPSELDNIEYYLDELYPRIRREAYDAIGKQGEPVCVQDPAQLAWVMEEAAREIRRLREQVKGTAK